MPEHTCVISVRGRSRDELLADPRFVYCGRGIYRGKANWQPSVWANPFAVGMKRPRAIALLGRDLDDEPRADTLPAGLAVKFYRAWLDGRPELLARLPELQGRVLGCWCSDWRPGDPPIPCHAVALARLANALELAAHA